MPFAHEEVQLRRGQRTGLPIIVAVHSTRLGAAAGGCRLWSYSDWTHGLSDALKLSEGMTWKCAAAGLSVGGGKTVIAVPEGQVLDPAGRRAALLDAGDVIASLDGRYATGPDAGTGPEDMAVIGERTEHVFCRPEEAGGSGDPSPFTALGVLASLRATCRVLNGSPDLAGRRFAVVGAGHVGERVARMIAEQGGELVVSDIAAAKASLADELGARFLPPREALVSEVDVLVPAALGGVLNRELVPRLRCAAIAGPANNQLAEREVAELLQERSILWAPDYVVNAGGVIHAIARELLGEDLAKATARVESIEQTLQDIFATAQETGTTPSAAADDLARRRVRGSEDPE
ncbi:Glu/Leu/Phe/Val dehydrogenase family protein [Saccharopolyspora sp. K220]|uniref:Glu/Leu/Phe/Val dehydrogenase family protein n=1 Tax=Saccharopolyspora soli TaxID=2926618 RepID=UPI001F562CD4|nr:Glu/Leu/Phe/Val dehydrogenase family protein [Saccharopolyspora soli]MCI2420114.1 Glu/Leu/Phe/Val dehydrogenase family protein [Saccharopolyspora soli]